MHLPFIHLNCPSIHTALVVFVGSVVGIAVDEVELVDGVDGICDVDIGLAVEDVDTVEFVDSVAGIGDVDIVGLVVDDVDDVEFVDAVGGVSNIDIVGLAVDDVDTVGLVIGRGNGGIGSHAHPSLFNI